MQHWRHKIGSCRPRESAQHQLAAGSALQHNSYITTDSQMILSRAPAICERSGIPASAMARDAAERAIMFSDPPAASRSMLRRTAKGKLSAGKMCCKLRSSNLLWLPLMRFRTPSGVRSLTEVLAYTGERPTSEPTHNTKVCNECGWMQLGASSDICST